MKKFLAIFLTVAMLASFMVVPALAAANNDEAVIRDASRTPVTNGYVSLTQGGDATFDVYGQRVVPQGGTAVTYKWEVTGNSKITIAGTAADKDEKVSVKLAAASDAKNDVAKVTVTIDEGATTEKVLSFYVGVVDAGSAVKFTKIDFDLDSTLLVVGDQIDLSKKIKKTPTSANENLFYYSSVPSVVEVDAATGNIEAKKAGSSRVGVISASGVSAYVDLVVVASVPPTGISIKSDVKLANAAKDASDATQLELIMTPSNGSKENVVWSIVGSSTFATNGLVNLDTATGKIYVATASTVPSELPAVVVVKAVKDGLSATTLVTIGATTDAYSVAVSAKPSFDRLVIGQTFPLVASVKNAAGAAPTDASVKWYSNNTSVAKVNASTGVVTAVDEGSAYIYAESVNGVQGGFTLTVVKEVEGSYKSVGAYTVKVRALPSSSSSELATYKKGVVVNVVETLGAWTKISYSGTYAYVATAALTDLSTGTVTSSSLTVRTSADSKAKVVDTLKYGATVKIVGIYETNPAWLQILHSDNTTAFVASKYISEGNLTGVVTAGTLNLRASASTTAPIYANKLVKAQSVEIIGRVGSFYQVKTADGFEGFAAAQYIEIL